jgi:hypothetical protein
MAKGAFTSLFTIRRKNAGAAKIALQGTHMQPAMFGRMHPTLAFININ